ncbi:peptidase S14 ClpP [Candidatus Amoebophilus asiaticus 5a2]|uniref:Peptidase S14 ClpP n=1 Tax=Amoebophilus asiaticus (strain 5a2) TaxID=452471 RepID=B3EUB4_AMOA5|nr:ATP-dependent Clp protease proteolytic subunit [Candidatus Amoebophilus asiaticus]ACE05533.1 peptidase S14 ClpP [Candidatus Amoebophilus asiaticus 5a2]
MQIKNPLFSIIVAALVFTNNHAQTAQVQLTAFEANKRTNKNTSKSTQQTNQKQSVNNQELSSSQEQDEDNDKEFKQKMKEQRKLEIETALIRIRLERELAEIRAEIERIRVQREAESLKWELEHEKNTKEYEKQILELNRQRDKIMAEVSLSQAKLTQAMDKFNATYVEIQNQVLLLRTNTEQVRTEIEEKKAKKERSEYADGNPEYLQDPLLPDGTLVLSDRAVSLDGVVTSWKANYITDRIKYFNNKDKTKPIFIVIENSPGGSALAGLHIVQAMQNSQAPVYVVLKTFAASMAALITTLAKKSYAYPNAILLHHQPWSFTGGNLRELKEEIEFMKELWKRLGGQVAKKMGISLDKLDKQLYEKASRGDWTEFADNAKKIKWVDHVITNINDTAIQEMPNSTNYTWHKYMKDYFDMAETSVDNSNNIYLPVLGPKDFYYLYNPDNTYQLRSNK